MYSCLARRDLTPQKPEKAEIRSFLPVDKVASRYQSLKLTTVVAWVISFGVVAL